MQVDTRQGVETPEGVTLELRPAGLVARFGAYAIDVLIRLVLYMVIIQIAVSAGKLGMGIALVCFFLIEWFYPVLFELWLNGATPGKRVMGIAVVESNGLPVSLGGSVTRNLLRFVDFLPFGYAAGLLSIILTKDFKRLGDLAANTVVVYVASNRRENSPAGATGTGSSGPASNLPVASPVATPKPLSADAQLALISLAARARYLTNERAVELMRIAEAVADDSGSPATASDSELAEKIIGRARWLMGERTVAPEQSKARPA